MAESGRTCTLSQIAKEQIRRGNTAPVSKSCEKQRVQSRLGPKTSARDGNPSTRQTPGDATKAVRPSKNQTCGNPKADARNLLPHLCICGNSSNFPKPLCRVSLLVQPINRLTDRTDQPTKKQAASQPASQGTRPKRNKNTSAITASSAKTQKRHHRQTCSSWISMLSRCPRLCHRHGTRGVRKCAQI